MTLYKASCHCQKVQFEIEGEVKNVVECNCSICRRRAHLLWFVPKSEMKFISGEDALSGYQFGKGAITHRFCKHCGIAMFSDGDENGVVKAGVNIRTLDGLDLKRFETFKYDGAAI